MGFWFALFLFVGTTVLSALLQKKPKDIQPSSLGDFQAPTAEEGRAIPVIFGTVKLAAPNVVWFGDLKINAIKKKVGGFLGIGGSKVTIGFKYFVGLHMALCHGVVDSLLKIIAGEDKDVPFTSTVVNGPGGEDYLKITIDQPKLFGVSPEPGDGGLKGTIFFYRGQQSQQGNSYLASKLGLSPAPAYRGLCHAVAQSFYVGNSQFMKKLAFVLRRLPRNLGLTGNNHDIGGDANPAEIIYEVMTNPIWGLGIPSTRFNLASFQSAGNTLATEGMGMSLQLDSEAAADQVLDDVLRHIDGVLYTDPATGLWNLALARADYSIPSLLELNENDILEAPEFSRGSWEETLNEIKVEYLDRATFDTRIVQAQETANFAIRGQLSSDTIPFRGFSNAAIAQKAAMRELKTHSFPLAKGRLKANRKAWNLRIGGVFKFTWTPLGISAMVVRITGINYGALEQGEITIDFVEDIFAVAFTGYTPPTSSGWTEPLTDPVSPTAQFLQEVPYHLTDAGERRLAVAAVRGDGTSTGFEVWTDEGAGFYQSNTVEIFCPSGVLQSAYLRNTAALDNTGFVVQGGRDLEQLVSTDAAGRARGANLLVIDDEWMSWTTVTDNGDGTYTISGIVRGVFDTIPADHLVGARVFFVSDGSGLTREDDYPADQTISAKCLPFNSRGTVPIGSVSAVSLAMAGRAQKPYPPGNVQVNGAYWPVATKEDASLTWAHRHRTAQTSVVQQDAGNQAAAPEGNYTVEVRVCGTLRQTNAGLTGTSQVYTALQRFTDDKDGSKTVVFRLRAINGSLEGTQRSTDAFLMGGMGMCLGLELGGRNA